MLKDYFVFAWTNLIHKKIRSWLTLLGILIGITAVVSLISLGDGLKMAVASQFGISTTEVISVQAGGLTGYGPPGTGVINPLTQDDVDNIKSLSSVDMAFARNVRAGKMEFNDNVGFGYAVSMPDGEERKFAHEVLELKAETGRLLRDGDNKKVVLGYNFYKNDENGFDKKISPGNEVLIQDEKFEVVGIMEKKGSFLFDNIVLMNDKPLSDLLDYGDDVDIIAVKVKDKDQMSKTKEDIEKLLRKTRDVKQGEEDFQVETPEAAMSSVSDVLTGVQVFISIIAGISIVVGGVGIVNTMKSSVLERKSQIGVMKAIGAKNRDIFMQFFVESGLMGLVGGLLGIIFGASIGYFGTVAINSFVGAEIKPEINLFLIIITLFSSFLIGAVAGIIPAMQAAKQKPVDALRG